MFIRLTAIFFCLFQPNLSDKRFFAPSFVPRKDLWLEKTPGGKNRNGKQKPLSWPFGVYFGSAWQGLVICFLISITARPLVWKITQNFVSLFIDNDFIFLFLFGGK